MSAVLHRCPSPVGEMLVVAEAAGPLLAVEWADHRPRMDRLLARHRPGWDVREAAGPHPAVEALRRYFEGDLAAIDGLAVAEFGTPFQRRVWAALRRIDAGRTMTYAALATAAGAAAAVRATGAANGANPVGVVVPCHRLVGADGALTGYGSGLPRKAWLLAHERRHGNRVPPAGVA